MRRLAFAALLAASALTTPASAENELFSEVAVESVFSSDKSETTGAKEATSDSTVARVTGSGQLGDLLRSLSYKTKRLDGKAVQVEVSHGGQAIPTTLRAAVDRSQVDIRMDLATPDKDTKWDADKLLRLLVADSSPAAFAFDNATGQIQLRQTISARNLSANRLNGLIKQMAELAVSRESSWSPGTPAADSSSPKATETTGLPAGSWLAKPASNEAFALQITASGTFSLAHVRAGRTVRSTGSATRSGVTLTLAGSDGTSVKGTVSGQTPAGFTLTLSGGRKLTFAKAG